MATIFSATLVPKQKLNGQVRFELTDRDSEVGDPGLIETSLNFSLPAVGVDYFDGNTYAVTITRV